MRHMPSTVRTGSRILRPVLSPHTAFAQLCICPRAALPMHPLHRSQRTSQLLFKITRHGRDLKVAKIALPTSQGRTAGQLPYPPLKTPHRLRRDPARSNSRSRSSPARLLSSGDRGPPCGMPSPIAPTKPPFQTNVRARLSTITPRRKNVQ